jgi:hypothetical protein
LTPIEELFDREFPDFSPYPWGRRPWIHLLVRNILLAEPLVQPYARCFAGVTAAEAETLASSFALGQCARREELADVLRDHLLVRPAGRPGT